LIRLSDGEEIELEVKEGFYRESELKISGRPTVNIREVFITDGTNKSRGDEASSQGDGDTPRLDSFTFRFD